jgi:hypothetical protein
MVMSARARAHTGHSAAFCGRGCCGGTGFGDRNRAFRRSMKRAERRIWKKEIDLTTV